MFAESRSLTELDNVFEAAREVGLNSDEVEESIQRPEIKERLKDQTQEALARGITGIPTVAIGDELFGATTASSELQQPGTSRPLQMSLSASA